MRKLLLSITCMLFASIAMAQDVAYAPTEQKYTAAELNAATTDTYIAIKNLSRTNSYWYVGNTGAAPYSKAEFTNDAVFVWSPVEAGVAGSYYLKKLDGTYMQATAPKDFGTIDNAAVFTATAPGTEGTFNGDGDSQEYINGTNDPNLVRFTTNGKWINVQNGDSGTPTYNNGTGGWTIHYAYAVEEVPTVNITYKFVYNNEAYDSETVVGIIGKEMPDFTKVFPFGIVANKPAEVVPDNDAEYTIELTVSLPFEYAESYSKITKWYYMTIRDDSPTYLVYDQNVNYIPAAATEVPEGEKEMYAWAFIGDPFKGFEIVNYAAGETMVLSAPETPEENKNADQLARMVVKENATGNTTWNFAAPTHNNVIAENGFYIQHPTAKSYAFNRQNYDNGNALCYWTGRDTGSTLQVIEADIETDTTTAVENVEIRTENEIYDITGRKVKNISKAGIYIVNGNKVLVK